MAEIPSIDSSENGVTRPSNPNSNTLSKLARVAGLGALLAITPVGTAEAQVKNGTVEVADSSDQSIEAAKKQLIKLAEERGRHVEFESAEIYRKGNPLFDSKLAFIKAHPKDFNGKNALLDEKDVVCIVSLQVAGEKKILGNVVVALDASDTIIGAAD